MAKELIRPDQFCTIKSSQYEEIELELSDKQIKELEELYAGTESFQQGKLIKGTIVKADSDGVLIDINYKSDGLIPRYEFGEHELKKLKAGDEIEVILDQLESPEGDVVLSYEKAKALKAWDAIMKLHEENKPVEGTVVNKVKGGLIVDIGIPAFLPGSQIALQRVTDFDSYVGQTITASILKINKKRGNVIISRRKHLGDQQSEARKGILEKLKEGDVIQGIVKNITNYGVFIDIGGIDGLLHITDITWGRISHPSELMKIGDQISVKVLSFDQSTEKISLGLKQLTDNPWEALGDQLKEGAKIKGKISSITDYGLFVEIAKGVEGLVHISEVSWTDRITNLHDKFKVRDEIEVLVVSLDKDNRRMSLSVKQLDANPWEQVGEQFEVGQKIKGTVSNITDFGIFVQLMPGIDGLVHISDLSWTEHIDHPSDKYAKSGEVEAMILNIDKDNKKISLGIKQLSTDPWEKIEQEYPVNTLVDGEVSKTTNFGAFVRLPSGIEGLVHISELSDKEVEKVEDILKVGEKRQFRVINVNKQERKLGLSLKLEPTTPKRDAARAEAPKRKAAAPKAKREEAPKSALQMALEEHARKKDEDK